MFLDTAFNSFHTVISNIHFAFIETATKMWTYARHLPTGKQPSTKLLINTTDLAFVLMKSKGKNKKNVGYKCGVSKTMVEWLAMRAFITVLRKRQARYTKVLEWLEGKMRVFEGREGKVCERLMGVVL
ncbi:hypothetical protein GLAREA_04978 [Glarea lozoyensis ATCC 20868]|uniref:Telomerase reverse transcriptase n=1 Tax=Glarea lozoyensis (strain ATCC 20868 / MF5171) TaxID=1116229 RepID=S3CNV1_GLAL2|nr:uncharacterized protein GLAREA_04978 [Glarea lozoyensis ATCC 20868]EPE28187.1 hypothetical protein GLAREA_04978 [Glarea lozoyensis ATCC 20868]